MQSRSKVSFQTFISSVKKHTEKCLEREGKTWKMIGRTFLHITLKRTNARGDISLWLAAIHCDIERNVCQSQSEVK